MKIDIKRLNNVIKSLYLLLSILIIYLLVIIINKSNIFSYVGTIINVLTPLIIGIFIAWLLTPVINYIEKKGINKTLSIIFFYLIIVLLIYYFFASFIPRFLHEFDDFIEVFPNILNKIINSINLKSYNIEEDLMPIINNLVIKLKENIPSTCVNLFNRLCDLIIGMIISFYLIICPNKFDLKFKKKTYVLLNKINDILRNYLKGTLISSLIVFIFCFFIFYIFGLKNPLLLGFVCGITNIIPFIGPYIGASIPVLISFTKGVTFGILITVLIFIIQMIEGNIIHPYIMSRSVNIHPVTSIVSLLIFGYFFGIFGMIISVPLIAIIKELYFYYRR